MSSSSFRRMIFFLCSQRVPKPKCWLQKYAWSGTNKQKREKKLNWNLCDVILLYKQAILPKPRKLITFDLIFVNEISGFFFAGKGKFAHKDSSQMWNTMKANLACCSRSCGKRGLPFYLLLRECWKCFSTVLVLAFGFGFKISVID